MENDCEIFASLAITIDVEGPIAPTSSPGGSVNSGSGPSVTIDSDWRERRPATEHDLDLGSAQ